MLRPVPKPTRPLVSPKLRQSARGQACTLRLDGCLPGNETVVLCHIRGTWAGIGQKPADFIAVYACHHCHDALDRRRGERPDGWEVVRALVETLTAMHSAGLLHVGAAR